MFSFAFITQSYFKVPKNVRLNSTHFFIMKIPNKRELQQIALYHSFDIGFKDFIKIYKKCIAEPCSFFWLMIQPYHQMIFSGLERILSNNIYIIIKAFEKQRKTIEDQGKKQVDALVALTPKEIKPRETKPDEYGDYFLNRLAKIRETYEPADFYNVD